VALTTVISNHFRFMLLTKQVDMDNDVFKAILMSPGFVFDPVTHTTLAGVTASQLPTGNGYTQDTATLTKTTPVYKDNAQNRAVLEWDAVQWAASGGDIGPYSGLIIYDDSTADKTVVGGVALDADETTADGQLINFYNLSLLA